MSKIMADSQTGSGAHRKADPEAVVERYRELRHLERTGLEFGITRERVRQIVQQAGISTARVPKPPPQRPPRLCRQCGATVNSYHSQYCARHRNPRRRDLDILG